MPGVIEDINISKIKQSKTFQRFNLYDDYRAKELSSSIVQKGLLQPIIVRSIGEFFEIVAGNRRYHACKSLGWRTIACHILELDDKAAFEVSLIENVQRKTLSTIDEAYAYKAYVCEFGWGGASELATKLGKSTTYVAKRVRLLELPPDVIESINNSALDASTAEELLSLKDKNKQSQLAQLITDRRLSMRKTRELLKEADKDTSFAGTMFENRYDNNAKVQRSFDKTIIAMRIAMNRLGTIIEGLEDNWIVYETLMNHKKVLHAQIDILIKEKRKV
jgi:ParB family transcriptional regulator, chromosome partitioning protein